MMENIETSRPRILWVSLTATPHHHSFSFYLTSRGPHCVTEIHNCQQAPTGTSGGYKGNPEIFMSRMKGRMRAVVCLENIQPSGYIRPLYHQQCFLKVLIYVEKPPFTMPFYNENLPHSSYTVQFKHKTGKTYPGLMVQNSEQVHGIVIVLLFQWTAGMQKRTPQTFHLKKGCK